jgi:hypothetical protein
MQPQSSAEDKNEWSYTATLPYVLMAHTGTLTKRTAQSCPMIGSLFLSVTQNKEQETRHGRRNTSKGVVLQRTLLMTRPAIYTVQLWLRQTNDVAAQ